VQRSDERAMPRPENNLRAPEGAGQHGLKEASAGIATSLDEGLASDPTLRDVTWFCARNGPGNRHSAGQNRNRVMVPGQ